MSASAATPRYPVVSRASGVTEAERYLHRLCEQSFLSLWSYAGVFRDQKADGKGDGKELCDVLVVFGDHVINLLGQELQFSEHWKRAARLVPVVSKGNT